MAGEGIYVQKFKKATISDIFEFFTKNYTIAVKICYTAMCALNGQTAMASTMGDVNELILQNYRCFRNEQRGRLRPITLLVGENSTGKSSFMASYMAIDQCFREQRLNDEPDFNLDPFELGSFKDIAYTTDKKRNGTNEFKIGMSYNRNLFSTGEHSELSICFKQKNRLPHVYNLSYRFGKNDFIEFERTHTGTKMRTPRFSMMFDIPLTHVDHLVKLIINGIASMDQNQAKIYRSIIAQDLFWSDIVNPSKENVDESIDLIITYLMQLTEKYSNHKTNETTSDFRRFELMMPNIREAIAMAPIRSKPKRSYDPIRELPNPEGDHIPMLIMRLSKTNQKYWNEFRRSLVKFGKASELFSDIRVESDESGSISSFEVQVKVRSGKFINIMDVGYGVSQSLPVIINILYHCFNGSSGNSLFLLQQPEVHMHPRGQAELSDFICNAFKISGNRFLIETHSDFIVDRMRLLVREGVVSESDVSIIYFEPYGSSVKLYNIELDEYGNLLNCPSSYRRFFSKETDRLVGIEE